MRRVAAWGRNSWRALTSMSTALALLFLLALGAIPGALLPQRNLNEQKVEQYIADHRGIGPWLDRLQAFNVFSSFWFTAIYVLLFVSLVGCLLPRMVEHIRSLRATPVAAPRNLSRLPKHAERQVSGEPAAAAVFMGFGENSLDFELRVWTDRFGDAETIQSELADSVYAALNEARIDLPVPRRDVRLRQVAAEPGKD